jgi:hypothetical protein
MQKYIDIKKNIQTGAEIQINRKTQTDWHKGTEKPRHTDRYIDTDTENIKTDRLPDTQTQKTQRQTDRETDNKIHRHRKHIDRQTAKRYTDTENTQTNKYTDTE